MNLLRWAQNTLDDVFTPNSANMHIPHNVAFIMDGNRTPIKHFARVSNEYLIRQLSKNPDFAGYNISLAKKSYQVSTPGGYTYEIDIDFPGWLGYIAGYERMRQVINLCLKYKIQVASFWWLSTDNIEKRPQEELSIIYQIIEQETMQLAREALSKWIKIELIGNREKLTKLSTNWIQAGIILKSLEDAVSLTQENTVMTAAMVLAYGWQDELTRASQDATMDIIARLDFPREASQEVRDAFIKKIMTIDFISQYVESRRKLGPLDMIVRTGSWDASTVRISGLFPWEDYPEVYQFSGSWLDFREKEFRRMLIAYSRADRKYWGESAKPRK